MKRNFRPTTNSPHIRKLRLWTGNENNETLQKRLDQYIELIKYDELNFAEDSVPRPMRFNATEIENASLSLKLKFDAKFDSHDFRVHPLHLNQLRRALREADLMK